MAFASLLNPFRRRRAREAELAELAGRLAVTRSPLGDALWRLRRNRAALVAATVLLLIVLVCVVGPWISPWDLNATDALSPNRPPGLRHWLGTDFLGRDILARLMAAGRISLTVGLASVLLSVVVGYIAGAVAGYLGGLVDAVIMRCADIVMTIPTLPLLIILGAVLSELKVPPDQRIYLVVVMLSLPNWIRVARLVRSQILSLRERDFMVATEVLGLPLHRRLFHHLLPNTVPILIVVATVGVADAILNEAYLSYLGLGVVPPTPSWGNMMDTANSFVDFQRRPWLWVPPGVAIFLTVVAINILGDGLRDALDPKMKR
ncbi:ABC transporter permease [Inquilinus limosus]|uniref:Peptide ABC transporter permease n=1 Tax=Inquilinus limosus TaxID=171674 RepID=A0A211ZMN5_9PROT|nr:ABC transporter permease [Inquilinus limosus]OWJ66548.1 peptide ABC transporter permease [Inquilinus limosus]